MAMMQKTLTIDLPESTENLHNLLKMLLQYGAISDKKARTIEQKEITNKQEKNRWARAADRLKSEGFLKGQGEEVKNLTRDFRERFRAKKDSAPPRG